MRVLGTDADEILVERARPHRNNVGPEEYGFVKGLSDQLAHTS